jgi:hypothetical protein
MKRFILTSVLILVLSFSVGVFAPFILAEVLLNFTELMSGITFD